MKKEQSNLSIYIRGESDWYLRFRCFLTAFFGIMYWIFFWKDCIFKGKAVSPEDQIYQAFVKKGLILGRFFQMGEETGGLYLCGLIAVLLLFLLFAVLSQKKIVFTVLMGGITVLIMLRTGWVPGIMSIFCLSLCLVTLFVPSLRGTLLLSVNILLFFLLCFALKEGSLVNWEGFQEKWEQWKYNENPEVLPEGKLEKARSEKRGEEEVLSVRMTNPSVYYLRGFTGTVLEDNVWVDRRESYSRYVQETQKKSSEEIGTNYENLTKNSLEIQNIGASRRFLYLPYECITRTAEYEEGGIAITGMGDTLYASGWTGVDHYQCTAYGCLSKGLAEQEEVYTDCLMLTREEKEIIAVLLGKKQANGQVSAISVLREVREWMGEHLQYDSTPGEIPEGESFVQWFLEDEKKGYDVQYATAAVMFFRYYGIPSRYVEGYLVTREDLSDGTSEGVIPVREKDAHAWAEIYLEGTGWIPVEVMEEYEDKMGVSYLENIDDPAVGQSNQGETEEKQMTSDEEQTVSEEETSTKKGETEKDEESGSLPDNNPLYNIEETQNNFGIGRILVLVFLTILILISGIALLRKKHRIREEKKWKESEDFGYCVDMYYRKLCLVTGLFAEEKEGVEDCLRRIDSELQEEELEYCMEVRQKALFSNTPITAKQRDRACAFLDEEWKKIYARLSLLKKIKFL